MSFGWINRELIASRKFQPHINVFGGEDRFWMGPEGGQFSIFFAKDAPFDLEHWFTPAPFDTEPFVVVATKRDHVQFHRTFPLTNYSGTKFDIAMWKLQEHPYSGDVANSYNDGPPAPGAKLLGPFYELESSSPALALAPGKSLEHVHRTIHLRGSEKELDVIALATLGIGLQEITNGLPRAAAGRQTQD